MPPLATVHCTVIPPPVSLKSRRPATGGIRSFSKPDFAGTLFQKKKPALKSGLSNIAADYYFSADSIAEITTGESGVTAGSRRAIGCPLREMRNLVKFHLISPPMWGAAVRYR